MRVRRMIATPGRCWRFDSGAVRLCLVLSIGLALTAGISGCRGDRGPERVVVAGTVAYNGKPVDEGIIRFMPVSTSLVPAIGARIADGKYRVDGHGGAPVGTHKIQIEAYRLLSGAGAPQVGARGVPHDQYLPKRYNAQSQLQITIEPGSREITKNFDLTD
jgi:hypothetical protein